MEKDTIRSKPIKKLVIFAGVGVVLSLAVILIFLFLESNWPIKITMWVFCGIFVIIGTILIWFQCFHFVSINDEKLTRHRGLFKKSIDFDQIDKVVNNEGLFDIMVNQKRFATLSTDDPSTKTILIMLEKHKVHIKW